MAKITYMNGLLINGELDPSHDFTIDMGTGELKFLVKGEDGLFEDYNPENHTHMKERVEDFCQELDMKIDPKKHNIKLDKKMPDQERQPLLDKVAEAVTKKGIPAYATGKWRDKCNQPEGMYVLTDDQEVAATALSTTIDAEAKEGGIYISGSLGYTVKGFDGVFKKPFALGEVEGKLQKIFDSYEFTAEDMEQNNANLGRLLAVAIHAGEKGMKQGAVSTGNSTVGFATQNGELKDTVGLPVEGTFTSAADENTTITQEMLAKVMDQVEGGPKEKGVFQVKAAALLNSFQFGSELQGDELKQSMEAKLDSYVQDPTQMDMELSEKMQVLEGNQTKVKATREVKADQRKLATLEKARETNAPKRAMQAELAKVRSSVRGTLVGGVSGRVAAIQGEPRIPRKMGSDGNVTPLS